MGWWGEVFIYHKEPNYSTVISGIITIKNVKDKGEVILGAPEGRDPRQFFILPSAKIMECTMDGVT